MGVSAYQLTPVNVSNMTEAVAVVAGGDHTCALTKTGGVKCWGSNLYGQLGDGTTTTKTYPVPVTNLTSGIVAVTAGFTHSCALTQAAAAG